MITKNFIVPFLAPLINDNSAVTGILDNNGDLNSAYPYYIPDGDLRPWLTTQATTESIDTQVFADDAGLDISNENQIYQSGNDSILYYFDATNNTASSVTVQGVGVGAGNFKYYLMQVKSVSETIPVGETRRFSFELPLGGKLNNCVNYFLYALLAGQAVKRCRQDEIRGQVSIGGGLTRVDGVNDDFVSDTAIVTTFGNEANSLSPSDCVVIGSGNTAVTDADYKLESIYDTDIICSKTAISEVQSDGTNVWVDFTRNFQNNTGSSITVKEMGLYTAGGIVMIDRVVLDTPITIANGEIKEIPYRFQITNA